MRESLGSAKSPKPLLVFVNIGIPLISKSKLHKKSNKTEPTIPTNEPILPTKPTKTFESAVSNVGKIELIAGVYVKNIDKLKRKVIVLDLSINPLLTIK